jgi:hypothetical protein
MRMHEGGGTRSRGATQSLSGGKKDHDILWKSVKTLIGYIWSQIIMLCAYMQISDQVLAITVIIY